MKITSVIAMSTIIVFFANTMQQQTNRPLTFKVKAFVTDNAQELASFAKSKGFSLESGLGAIFFQLGQTPMLAKINLKDDKLALKYAFICLQRIDNDQLTQDNISKVIKAKKKWAEQKNEKTDNTRFLAEKSLQTNINFVLTDLLKKHNHNFKFPQKNMSFDDYKYRFFQLNEHIDSQFHIPFVAGELIARGILQQHLDNKTRAFLLKKPNSPHMNNTFS